MDEGACVNTDKEIWRKVKDDYYSPRIYVTKQNGITFCVGGNCVTNSIEDWFALATPTFSGEKEVMDDCDDARGEMALGDKSTEQKE